jgi:hypothetical protein
LIKVKVSGSFKHVEDFTQRMSRREQFKGLGTKFGPVGVAALAAATPVDSGDTAQGWYYEVVDEPGHYAIHWLNSNMRDMIPVAVLLQYGHATRSGGHIAGIDYINPALAPIFRQIADDMWKVVTK